MEGQDPLSQTSWTLEGLEIWQVNVQSDWTLYEAEEVGQGGKGANKKGMFIKAQCTNQYSTLESSVSSHM